MSDDATTAEAAVEAEPNEEASIEAAADAIRARESAEEAAAEGKEHAASSPSPTKPAAAGTAAAPTRPAARPAPRDIAALASREWKTTQALQEAKALEAKYSPIDQMMAKGDLAGVLGHLAATRGFKLGDFIAAMSEEKPKEKTAAEIAAETVAAELRKRDEAAEKARTDAQRADIEARIAKVADDAQALADKGDGANPDRWELTAVSGKAAEVWAVVEGWYDATATKDSEGRIVKPGEMLTMEAALDKIEEQLRQRRDARKPKTEGKAGVAAKPQAAAAGKQGGKAAAPSFSNRNTSSAASTSAGDTDDDLDVPDHEAIRRAARRANISI